MIIPGDDAPAAPSVRRDDKLVALLAEAKAARDLILSMPDHSLNSIGKATNRCRTRLRRLFGLSYLAPDIVSAILDGKQPEHLSSAKLLETDLPLDWKQQRKLLAFA